MDVLLTTKELAELLRLNEKKIYQLIRESGIPHIKMGGKWLFPKSHVLRWIDENVEKEKDIFVVGSDDVLLARLLTFYSCEKLPRSLAYYSPVGSLTGMETLSQKKAHASCIHVLDFEIGEYNLPYLSRRFSSQDYVVSTLWHRTQGLIVKKQNPLGIRGLEDVIKKGARFINRNRGSGTRVLLDFFLAQKGLDGKEMVGYSDEVDSHLQVALKVLSGEADVGLGIEFFSHILPLEFIFLQEERFDLVIPEEIWGTKAMKEFIAFLDPINIYRISQNFPGYRFKDTGKIIS